MGDKEMLAYCKDRKCPKCGGEANAFWCPGGDDYAHNFHDNPQFHHIDRNHDHIHRHCQNCRYSWPEKVMTPEVGEKR